ETLVRPTDVDLRPTGGAPDLEHVGLDVLSDPVVLDGRLLSRREDCLDALPDVEDDRPGLHAVDGPGDHLAFAARKLIEDDVALRFPQALEDDLLRRLRVDSPERLGIQLLGLDQLSDSRVGLVPTRFVDREFGQWILDLADHLTGT